MKYAITHTVQDKGYDGDPHTLTVKVKGDALRVDDQGHLLVEHIRENEDGEYYKTIQAIFKDWECAVPVYDEYKSSGSTSISSDSKKEPGKLILNKEEQGELPDEI